MLSTPTLQIQQAFNKATATYDNHALMQAKAGETLIDLVIAYKANFKTAIDIGCGTGFTTKKLAAKLTHTSLHAIDIADQLLKHAQLLLKPYSAHVYLKNFDDLSQMDPEFDLIFSNMALQWSVHFFRTLTKLTNILSPGGLLAFSIPLEKTTFPFHNHNQFFTNTQVKQYLQACNLHLLTFKQEIRQEHYASILEAARALKATGATYQFTQNKQQMPMTTWRLKKETVLQYHIGYFIAAKLR